MKKNVKVAIAFILGFICSSTVAYAATLIASSEVLYDNSKSKLESTNVQGALDELYTKAESCGNGGEENIPSVRDNKNVLAVYKYTYNKATNPTGCITGEEDTCEISECTKDKTVGSCEAGTIIKYNVNDSETKYFHVLHDDGATLTLQQRENTVPSVFWDSAINNNGPMIALPALESATSGWSNVNTTTYVMGTTNFNNTNAYTGCDRQLNCTTNTYTLGQRSAKSRMITVQEAKALGCRTSTSYSCPVWMNNYLEKSTNWGGTTDYGTDTGYWTMNADTTSTYTADYAFEIYQYGRVDWTAVNSKYPYGARAVVVINK